MVKPYRNGLMQMKQHLWRENIYTNEPSKVNTYTSEPSKVLELIPRTYSTKLLTKNWESFVSHVIKEEEKFRKTDHIVDNEIEPVVIKYCSSSDSDSDSDVEHSKLLV